MKLRNKKTGEIGWLYCDYLSIPKKMIVFSEEKKLVEKHWDYNSLAELNKEWEDYEDYEGDDLQKIIEWIDKGLEDELLPISVNDFVEKLKAYKRLKDKGFKWLWYNSTPAGDSVDFYIDDWDKEATRDITFLFGGENECF